MSDTSPADRSPSLSSILRERRAEILAEWARLARTVPPAARLSEAALIDHMPQLLDRIAELADQLACGDPAALPEREAAKHARQRWRKGYELHQVLREHALLRRVVAGLDGLDRDALRCIGEAIDEAMVISAEMFAQMSERGMTGIVSAIYDGVLIVNAEGRVVLANEGAARVYGMTPDELRIPLAEFSEKFSLRMPDGGPATPIAHRALAGELVPWADRVIVDPVSREERHVRASAAPLRSPDGEVEGAVVVVSDITERVRGERLREEILAIVSHDLRNPLGAIQTSAQVLLRSSPEPRAARQVATIQRAAARMDRLIGDLVDMASLQAGRLALELRPTAAAALVEDAIQLHEAVAQEKGVALRREPGAGPGDVTVLCDRERISQVFANLLGNALKFCRGGDSVTIAAAAEEREARFAVADTGPGIAPEDVDRVFLPYWSASRYARQGTGLGLHISKGIVEAHGGRIWVESRPGAGATFQFTLPLCP